MKRFDSSTTATTQPPALQRMQRCVLAAFLVGVSAASLAAQPTEPGPAAAPSSVPASRQPTAATPAECSSRARHLPLDHGPHAATTPYIAKMKMAECASAASH